MISQVHPDFWRAYEGLPGKMQSAADLKYDLWRADPWNPALHFKPMRGNRDLWSIRIADGYRALAWRKDEHVIWFWIGPHDQYERVLRTKR